MNNVIKDYSIYKKVNILENIRYSFHIDKININNKLYYNISSNQCACDFFGSRPQNKILQNEFMKFVYSRMEITCIEPLILLKWIEDARNINNIPNKAINICKNNLLDIFSKKYGGKELYFCIKRE
ncbi:MAG: hypothetical protein LBU83_03090 [Bacteroidales bacterium]|nr:hypothetical protein [Bacteroidales bacterium]